MNKLKFLLSIFVASAICISATSCEDNQEQQEYRSVEANAAGIAIETYPDRISIYNVNLWIDTDIEMVQEISEEYSSIIIYSDLKGTYRYFPLTMNLAEDFLLQNTMHASGGIDDHRELKETYDFIKQNKSKYKYITNTVDVTGAYGIILFNRIK